MGPKTATLLAVSMGLLMLAPILGAHEELAQARFSRNWADGAAIWTGRYLYLFSGDQGAQWSGAHWTQALRYDPEADRLETVPVSTPDPLVGAAGVWTGTEGFVIGGGHWTGAPLSKKIFRFHPDPPALTPLSFELPVGIFSPCAAWTGHSVIVAGGKPGEGSGSPVWEFDEDGPVRSIATLPLLVGPSCLYHEGHLYVIGGSESGIGPRTGMTSRAVHKVNVATGEVRRLSTEFPEHGTAFAMTAVDGARVYVLGGNNEAVGSSSDVYRFDAATERLHRLAPITLVYARGDLATVAPTRQSGPAFVYGDRIFLVGGRTNDFLLTTITRLQLERGGVVANLTVEPHEPVVNYLMRFRSTSNGHHQALTSWQWNIGGRQDGNETVEVVFDRPGPVEVRLNVIDEEGRTAAIQRFYDVLPSRPPRPAFTFSPAHPVAGRPVQFTDSSTDPDGVIVRREWDFGTAGTSQEAAPVVRFLQAGRSHATLTVTDDTGLRRSVTQSLPVHPGGNQPIAYFDYAPREPRTGDAVQFRDQSYVPAGELASYEWHFGDNSISRETHPSHVFAAPGEYKVRLRVIGARADNETTTRIAVSPRDISFSVHPLEPRVGEPVRFTDTSTDLDQVAYRRWTFGADAAATTPVADHVFGEAGIHIVRLQQTLMDGRQREYSRAITVAGSEPPTAAFDVFPQRPQVGAEVTFLDRSSGSVTSWTWDFGDGNASSGPRATHVYDLAGEVTVRLRVEDALGREATREHRLTLVESTGAQPTALFRYRVDAIARGTVHFTDESVDPDGQGLRAIWDFGDGVRQESELAQVTHAYAAPGNYTVRLFVEDDTGATSSYQAHVAVTGRPPVAAFEAPPGRIRAGQAISFVDRSSDPDGIVRQWRWSFGDGKRAEERSPQFTFERPGTYTVVLSVTDVDGYAHAAQRVVEVEPATAASIIRPSEVAEPGTPGVAANAPILIGAAMVWVLYRRRR